MAGIITGVSDLSLMGRPVTANEVIGFEWVHRYKPLEIQVMTGSVREDGKTPALAVLVSQTNLRQESAWHSWRQSLAARVRGTMQLRGPWRV
jgi:phosphate transport system substrate-binding protein